MGRTRPSEGRALARCALEVLEAAGARGERPLLLSDHNGEEFRAWEWGMLLLHLRAQAPEWEGLRTWLPATGLGDTGAASGAVATCVATRALQRGYAPSRLALVLSAADGPERAALLVGRPPLAGT